MKIKPVLTILGTALILSACAGGPDVRRVPPEDPRNMSMGIDQADVNETVDTMINSMFSAPSVIRATGGEKPPTVVIVPVWLDPNTITDTRINTDAITTLVRGRVINSGMFQFIDAFRRDDIASELSYQNDSGMVDPATAKKRGKQVGADYILEGTISGFDSFTGNVHKKGYVITLTLQNIETAVIIWQGTQQIAKEMNRPPVGR